MIPLFPLQLVVYPFEKVNLHIFEPRYKELISDINREKTTFGIVPYLQDKQLKFGTEIKLIKIAKVYADGKMDVKTEGMRTFILDDFYGKYPEKSYPGGEITYLENDYENYDPILKNEILNLINILYSLMDIKKKAPVDTSTFYSYDVAHHIGLSIDQEYEILQCKSEQERLEIIHNHLQFLIPQLKEMEELRKKIEMNGHFKNIIPPEI